MYGLTDKSDLSGMRINIQSNKNVRQFRVKHEIETMSDDIRRQLTVALTSSKCSEISS